MAIIQFEHVSKSYGSGNHALKDLNLFVEQGEFIALIGPSGCGKTTLLKLINALIKPDSGKLYIKDREINDWNVVSLRRRIGYVIQQIGLFPHMNIAENISYVLNITGVSKPIRERKAKELIALVGLDESYLRRYPGELSGGQQQRIGVARALAGDPDIILMDEPFGAVDVIVRRSLQEEIINVFKSLNKTILFVTHDIEEAFRLGTRIILLNQGKIEQDGTKEEMMFTPASQFVEEFFGDKNFGAYLNAIQIKDVFTPGTKDSHDIVKQKSGSVIHSDASVMEGIKKILENGADSLSVTGGDGIILGAFLLEDIRGLMTKRGPDK